MKLTIEINKTDKAKYKDLIIKGKAKKAHYLVIEQVYELLAIKDLEILTEYQGYKNK